MKISKFTKLYFTLLYFSESFLRKNEFKFTLTDGEALLKGHPTFQPGDEAHQTSLSITFAGILNLTVRDWNTYPPPSNYYNDNSGVYILDIFVIDPDQEESFNRFRDALFKANPEDSNVKAYLGLR